METKEGKETLLSQPPTEPRGVLVLRIDRAPCSPLILINCEIDPSLLCFLHKCLWWHPELEQGFVL